MSFSINTVTSDGVETQFPVSFTNGIYDRNNVKVYVQDDVDGTGNPLERSFTWINDGIIELDVAAPAGKTVTLKRVMNKNEPDVNYVNGAILDESNLNQSLDQLLAIQHEILDGAGIEAFNQDIDMNGYRLTNVGQGTQNTDGVNLQQLNAVIAAAGTGLIASQREVQTGAQVSSLVTTFTGITYTVGGNNLYIFLNGNYQTTGVDYTETSDSSITWLKAINSTDGITAITNLATTNSTTDTSAITHSQSGTNYNLATYLQAEGTFTLSQAVASTSLYEGAVVTISDRGYGVFDVVLASGVTPNTYNIVQCTGVATLALVYRIENNEVNAITFGHPADGTDQHVVNAALEDFALANNYNIFYPEGVYDNGASGFPFTSGGVAVSSYKDYKGMIVRGAGFKKTIFRTTSANGKDVLNIVGVENLTMHSISVTAILTGTSGAGSNGLSIVHGARNLDLNLDIYDCPGLDATTFWDGGKAFTLQNGTSSLLPFENIKIRGRATNCGYAVGCDLPYILFDTDGVNGIKGVDIDVFMEDCWRGVVLSAGAASAAITEQEKGSNFKVRGTAYNCAQSVVLGRWVNGDINVHVISDKPIASLYRPYAADQAVYAATATGCFGTDLVVTGRMKECNNKLLIGGTTQAFSVYGGCKNINLKFSLEAETVTGADISVLNVGGNVAINSTFQLAGITDTSYTGLMEASGILKPQWENAVTLQAKYFTSQQEIQQLVVQRQGQVYTTFEADAVTGDVKFLRAGSGSAGTPDGFMAIKDTNTGSTYKIQLYT